MLSEPVVFTPADSGTEKYLIIYEAATGSKPVFTGGRAISDFRRDKDGIWTADIPEVEVGK